jgi:transcriptional regulator with XRE-family HTH domain
MDLLEHVAKTIRDLRTSHGGEGLSQEALAKELNLATNTISRWETGTYKPALDDLDRLARFFNVSVLEFFPPQHDAENTEVAALMRAAKNLSEDDLKELRRYAEWRRAQSLYREGTRPSPGRKRKADK